VYRDWHKRSNGERPWCLYYIGLDGKRHRERTQAPTKSVAEELLKARLVEIERKRANPDSIIARTLADFAPEYLQYMETRGRSKNYVRLHKLFLDRYLIAEFGADRLSDIKPGAIEKYMDKRLVALTPRGTKTSPATVFQELMCLSALFEQAIVRGHATTNPVRRVEKPKSKNLIERYLETKEEEALLARAPLPLQPLIQTALHTGLRKGELINLTWPDVDLEENRIFVRPKEDKAGGVEAWAPKRNKARAVPINSDLRKILEAIPRSLVSPYVFVNPETGKLWHEIDLNLAWYATLKKAGIKGFRFHDMRHTFASRLVQAGVSLKTVAQLLGHSSVVVTERYSHLAPSNLENAVEVLTSAGRNEVLTYSRRKSASGGSK